MFEAILSDDTIMKYNRKGILIEQPITKEQLQPNSVDLTLDNEWKLLRPNSEFKGKSVIDPMANIRYKSGKFHIGKPGTKYEGYEYFILKPNEFCLMSSQEVLNIPNGIVSFVQGRSSIARIAIQTEQAGLIDSGFKGNITFEVYNQSQYPIILYKGMRIAQVYFFKSERARVPYGSVMNNNKYQLQTGTTGSKIDEDLLLKEGERD